MCAPLPQAWVQDAVLKVRRGYGAVPPVAAAGDWRRLQSSRDATAPLLTGARSGAGTGGGTGSGAAGAVCTATAAAGPAAGGPMPAWPGRVLSAKRGTPADSPQLTPTAEVRRAATLACTAACPAGPAGIPGSPGGITVEGTLT